MTISEIRNEAAAPAQALTPGARCPGAPSVEEVYERELGVLPDLFREHSPDMGTSPIPVERYISRDFHDLEVEAVWKHSWQLACLTSDLAEVGDTQVYEIGQLSFVLVRTDSETVKAYWNSCLHRGTQLRSCGGNVSELRCPFHGWAWNLDGSLKDLPAAWDLAHLAPAQLGLPEVRVGTWGPFVFLNPDRNASPLEEQLGVIPEHFQRWPLTNRVKTAHAVKILNANWKTVMGAFMESYHLVTTHPQTAPSLAGESAQYSIFGNVARLIALQGYATPPLADAFSQQDILDATLEMAGVTDHMDLPEGMTAREFLRMGMAEQARQTLGFDPLPCSDSELLDLPLYYLFPNFVVWGGFALPFVYRFRPYGNNPEMSVFDIMVLTPFPEGAELPDPAEPHLLQPDDSYLGVPNLPIADVFDQDATNLPRIQRGMHSSASGHLQLANYQESIIRWHDNLITSHIEQYGSPKRR